MLIKYFTIILIVLGHDAKIEVVLMAK